MPDSGSPFAPRKSAKFVFAGSGDSVWRTHRNIGKWQRVDDPKDAREPTHSKKLHFKNNIKQAEVSFAGPGGATTKSDSWNPLDRYNSGPFDRGSNSISRTSTYAFEKYRDYLDGSHDIKIKGHSRGAVAAGIFALSLTEPVNLVLFDPVPGPGHGRAEENLNLRDLPTGSSSTVVYSINSGWDHLFWPSKVSGAGRVIISIGDHGTGVEGGFTFNGRSFGGNRLNELPGGLYYELIEGVLTKADGTSEHAARMAAQMHTEVERSALAPRRDRSSRARILRSVVQEDFFPNHPQETFWDKNGPISEDNFLDHI